MENKINELKNILASYKSVVAGYSGGIDSTLLCYYANEVLKNNCLVITAISETLPPEELDEAIKIAKTYNWNHLIIKTDELNNKKFTSNTAEKCKWCKDIRFKALKKIAEEKNVQVIISGDNMDDLNDYRPGFQHGRALGVKSPLIEAGFNKEEIRKLAKEIGLPNYNKPATPCLASRIPYGIKITPESLKKVLEAEKLLNKLGYKIARVRHYNNMAKIEIEKEKIIAFVSFHSSLVAEKLNELGYKHVSLDLEGYRMGSLNEDIKINNE